MNGIDGMINRLDQALEKNEQLAQRVIGLAMAVHRNLGLGLAESLYVEALVVELRLAKIVHEREKRFTVNYKGVEIGYYVADLVVDGRLIVEAKAVSALAVAHSIQLVNYLGLAGIDLGLLLNFGARKLEFKTKTRTLPSDSESPIRLQ